MKIDLLLMRHAEATPFLNEELDGERRLTENGHRMAASNSQYLKANNWPIPKFVFTSGYLRAEQTRLEIAAWLDAGIIKDWVFSPQGNSVAISDFLAAFLSKLNLKEAKEDCICIAIVGHNPTIADLRSLLLKNNDFDHRGFQLCELSWLEGFWGDQSGRFEGFEKKVLT